MVADLWLATWPAAQSGSPDSPANAHRGLIRIPDGGTIADVMAGGSTVPAEVLVMLSPLGLAPWISSSASEDLAAMGCEFSRVDPAVTFIQPDGSVVEYALSVVGVGPLLQFLDAEGCDPPLPKRNDAEDVSEYHDRLLKAQKVGRRYLFDAGVGGDAPFISGFPFSYGPAMVCNDAFREQWAATTTAKRIAELGEDDLAFTPLSDRIQYEVGQSPIAGVGGGGSMDVQMWTFRTSSDTLMLPVDLDRADPEGVEEGLRDGYALPTWASSRPLPLTVGLREIFYEYRLVAAGTFAVLKQLLGDTITAEATVLLEGADGAVGEYVEWLPAATEIVIDVEQVRPPFSGELTRTGLAAELLGRKSRGERSTIPIPAEVAASTELFRIWPLPGPLVSSAFVDAWQRSATALAMPPYGGLEIHPFEVGLFDYRLG